MTADTGPKAADGFAEFVTTRSAGLLRAAWLLTGDAGKAEDLLQTALAKSWRRWSTIVEGGAPEAYVRRALYTTYVSWWRRHWRAEVPGEPPDQPGDRDMATQAADRDVVRRALARLSRQQRAVVVLRYVEDLSVADTAELLGCSAATVRVQAGRALRLLRADPDLRVPGAGLPVDVVPDQGPLDPEGVEHERGADTARTMVGECGATAT